MSNQTTLTSSHARKGSTQKPIVTTQLFKPKIPNNAKLSVKVSSAQTQNTPLLQGTKAETTIIVN